MFASITVINYPSVSLSKQNRFIWLKTRQINGYYNRGTGLPSCQREIQAMTFAVTNGIFGFSEQIIPLYEPRMHLAQRK